MPQAKTRDVCWPQSQSESPSLPQELDRWWWLGGGWVVGWLGGWVGGWWGGGGGEIV